MQVFALGPFRNAYLFRGTMVWAGIRLAFALLQVVALGVVLKFGILVMVGTVVYFDAKRRDEDLFLGNLGISGGWIAIAAVPIPFLLEFIVL